MLNVGPSKSPRRAAPAADVSIGGVTPLTTIDFPGRLAAVIYLRGCPWRCGYCHNRSLQAPVPHRGATDFCWQETYAFLERRRSMLDAVVFSGGEPTAQRSLCNAMVEVRDLGFEIGLHTAGPYPNRLRRLLPLVDWVGMDIKAPFDRYERITGVPDSGAKARQSARYLLASGVDHEFRTTLDTALLSVPDVLRVAQQLAELGVRRYALQRSRDPDGARVSGWLDDLTLARLGGYFDDFVVRC
jgi:pyruvate formate lyase activating enzyme